MQDRDDRTIGGRLGMSSAQQRFYSGRKQYEEFTLNAGRRYRWLRDLESAHAARYPNRLDSSGGVVQGGFLGGSHGVLQGGSLGVFQGGSLGGGQGSNRGGGFGSDRGNTSGANPSGGPLVGPPGGSQVRGSQWGHRGGSRGGGMPGMPGIGSQIGNQAVNQGGSRGAGGVQISRRQRGI